MTKIVQSLLAVAASSSVLLAQGGGWTGGPGKGLKFDGGESFSLKIDNQLQTHWEYRGGDVVNDTSSFDVRRARTAVTGHAYNKSIRYVLRVDAVDAGADGNLKDGHITWDFHSNENGTIGLRMGQGKTGYGLEGTGTSKGLFFVERSSASNAFADARSTGAWLRGSHHDNSVRWTAGAMNGSTASGLGGEEAANADNELSYALTLQFDPMGDTLGGAGNESRRQGDFRTDDRSLCGTVGVGLGIENGRNGANTADVDSTALNLNTAWSVNGFQFMGEYFMRSDETDDGSNDEEEPTGWAISGTYVLADSGDSDLQWGFGARLNSVESDMGTFLGGFNGSPNGTDDVTEITLVANAFYHGHDCKTQFEYTMQTVSPTAGDDTDNHILRIAFQILF